MNRQESNPEGTSTFWTQHPLATTTSVVVGVVGLTFSAFIAGMQFSGEGTLVTTQCLDGSVVDATDDCPAPTAPIRVQCLDGSVEDDVGKCPDDLDETGPEEGAPSGPEIAADDGERETPLDFSLLVSEQSNNLNWSVQDLTPDIAAFGVNGEPVGPDGVVFKLGDYSAQTSPPTIEAEFNLGGDYSALRALVGLTDNSAENDPVQLEVVDVVGGEVLFNGTVAVGASLELDLPVVDMLRVRVAVVGGTQFSSSWLTFSSLR